MTLPDFLARLFTLQPESHTCEGVDEWLGLSGGIPLRGQRPCPWSVKAKGILNRGRPRL